MGEGVAGLGGLHVIGTERHESRRIDRQLRGRCARQGDPGSSHFFISLEDDLMRLFGSDRIVKCMEKMGLEEGQELEHFMLNKSIEQAQKRVEQHNFQRRKRTLEYDDVMNKQREVIYGFRDEVINSDDVRDRLDGHHGGNRHPEGARRLTADDASRRVSASRLEKRRGAPPWPTGST